MLSLPKDNIEKVNVLTHIPGIFLSIAYAIWAFQFHGSILLYNLLFAVSMLLTYYSSVGYHWVSEAEAKTNWRTFDHICIYLLIAGTNTPLVMQYLGDSIGPAYLFIMWGLVVLGIFYKIFFYTKYPRLSVPLYLFLGWMAVFVIVPMWDLFPKLVIQYIFAGGIAYTLGVGFYAWDSQKYAHSIWHIFVLLGNGFHCLAIVESLNGIN